MLENKLLLEEMLVSSKIRRKRIWEISIELPEKISASERCLTQSVQSVERTVKFRSNQVMTHKVIQDRFTVKTAMLRDDQVDTN